MLAKPPSPVEVYNDIDGRLVNLFRVVRNPEKFREFHRQVALTPHSRREWRDAVSRLDNPGMDEVARAVAFYVAARQSFCGTVSRSWAMSVRNSRRGMAGTTAGWLSAIDRLPEIAERLLRVQVEDQDWRDCMGQYDGPDTFFYCDPPYPPEVRSRGSRSVYSHEMSVEDHRELVQRLLRLEGMAMLSGYVCELYRPLEEAGWKRVDWPVSCYAAARTRASGIQGKGTAAAKVPRVESVWLSPTALCRNNTLDTGLGQLYSIAGGGRSMTTSELDPDQS